MKNIDTTTPEGKAELNRLLVDAVINAEPDKIDGNGKVKTSAYEAYKEALIILADLQAEGKCSFSYDSLFEPYYMHCIFITWIMNDKDYMQSEASELSELLSKFDSLLLDKQEPFVWQLSTKIYFDNEDIP